MDEELSKERRLAALEIDRRDHARILGEYLLQIRDHEDRLDKIESERLEEKVPNALSRKDIDDLRKDMDAVKSGVNRVQWIVIAGVVTAFLTFVLQGGLKIL